MTALLGALAISSTRSSLARATTLLGWAGNWGGVSTSPSLERGEPEGSGFGTDRKPTAVSLRGDRRAPRPGSEGAGLISSRPHQNRPTTTRTNARAGKNQVWWY